MKRVFPLIVLLLGLVGLTGCRMCGSCDNLVPAFVERPNDYRGSNIFYRAGSIFGPEQYGSTVRWGNCVDVQSCGHGSPSYLKRTSPTIVSSGMANEYLVESSDVRDVVIDDTPVETIGSSYSMQKETFSDNAGHFGQTTPIDKTAPVFRQPTRYKLDEEINKDIPTVNDIIKQRRRGEQQESQLSIPVPTPIQTPMEPLPAPTDAFPTQPSTPTLPLPNDSEKSKETFPFSNHRPVPQMSSPSPIVGEPVITLETLRQLDPSASDIKIINIEDSVLQ